MIEETIPPPPESSPAEGVPIAPESNVIPISRDRQRSSRKRAIRAVTESMKRMPKKTRVMLRLLSDDDALIEGHRPKTRADCEGGIRPCPFVSCKYNLFLDVQGNGNLKLNFPDIEPEDVKPGHSCVLDVADGGGATLEEVGELMNLTRERVRQMEVRALNRRAFRVLREHAPPGELVKVRAYTSPSLRRGEELVDQDDDDDEDSGGARCHAGQGSEGVGTPPPDPRTTARSMVPRSRPPPRDPSLAGVDTTKDEILSVLRQGRDAPHDAAIAEAPTLPPSIEETTPMGTRATAEDLADRVMALVEAVKKLTKELGRSPSFAAIAAEIGLEGSVPAQTQAVGRALKSEAARGVFEWDRTGVRVVGPMVTRKSTPPAAPTAKKQRATKGKPKPQNKALAIHAASPSSPPQAVPSTGYDPSVSVASFLEGRRARLHDELAQIERLREVLDAEAG